MTKRSPAAAALSAGELGALPGRLARELRALGAPPADPGAHATPDDAESLFFFCGAGAGDLLPRRLAAAGLLKRLRRAYLIRFAPPSVDGLVAEDALRYLAAQRGASLRVMSAYSDASAGVGFVRRRAAAAGFEPARPPAPVVVVTGAGGQIGRAMTRLLDERGIAHRDVLSPRAADAPPAPGRAPALRCDLADPGALDGLAEFCAPATHVMHLASRISSAKDLAEEYPGQFRLNVGGALNLLQALPPAVRHISFASSLTVYGSAAAAAVDEDQPPAPNCVYALCKLAVERHLRSYAARTGVRTALLRYSSAYGPGPARGRAIPAMIARLLDGLPPEVYGAGAAKRDYVYLDDLCRATLAASFKEAEGVFNIGTGKGTTTAELAALLARLAGTAAAPVFIPRALDAQSESSLVYDIGKMRRELGCAPRVSLEEGLLETIRYFRELRAIRQAG